LALIVDRQNKIAREADIDPHSQRNLANRQSDGRDMLSIIEADSSGYRCGCGPTILNAAGSQD
jgi:hypothetical protein